MDTDILAAVIDVERKIRDRISCEEARLRERIEQVRQELAGLAVAEEERLQREMDAAVAAARDEALRRASLIRAEAVAWGERLDRLDDATLRRIVLGRLGELVGGAGHDRQDGEG